MDGQEIKTKLERIAETVGRGFQGAQIPATEGFQHPGVHTVTTADLFPPGQPGIVLGGTAPGPLGSSPLTAGQGDILDEGSHFAGHLSPGQAKEQAVEQEENA